ncbi:MAG: hypothetical protein GX489_09205 [Firmicutes bacterium]|jgi:hypothetical protein|nr:hypothetical protein [Bacillota bacterium]
MRRSKFCSGLFAGFLLGGLFGLASYPNLKPETKGRIIQAHQRINRATRMMGDMWRRLVKD